jgi:SAM-dependent methyltransferase
MELEATTKSEASRPCRFCGAELRETFIDLGMSPLCETFPSPAALSSGEMYYPLHVYVCEKCFLVQLEEFETPQNIFSDYPYFSSYSDSYVAHAKSYVDKMIPRLGLNGESSVIEAASNDGYLLQYFVKQGIPVLGIEPAANVAKDAVKRGVPTLVRFLGTQLATELAREGKCADLVLGNNVLAQVPDLNDFVEGLKILLKPDGVLTLEFPHLLRTIQRNEFDTIYHEHFSYFSLLTTVKIMEAHGLRVFDVDEIPTHGGSIRVYSCRKESTKYNVEPIVQRLVDEEHSAGLAMLEGYKGFADRVKHIKLSLMNFLLSAAQEGKSVVGYGAPGKSATLLHYCGVTKDLLAYTVDRNPHKHGRFCPGTRIPIHPTEKIEATKPAYVVILPWNLKDEIMQQLHYVREWGGRLVVPIPELTIH